MTIHEGAGYIASFHFRCLKQNCNLKETVNKAKIRQSKGIFLYTFCILSYPAY